MSQPPNRTLPWDACLNVRDLGGYRIVDGGITRWGALLRSDTLTRLSPDGCAALIEYGVRTIIDLRSPDEIASDHHPFAESSNAITYHALPLFADRDPNTASWITSARSLAEMYEVTLTQSQARIIQALRTIANADPGAVLFHCHAGKDRTGLIAMFVLAIAGVPDETIIADYTLSDQNLASIHDEILARFEGQPERQQHLKRLLHIRPEYMQATLQLLQDRYGGPLGYLSAAGLTPPEINRIRQRLVS
jgi:protein-tyrosine phosphatase